MRVDQRAPQRAAMTVVQTASMKVVLMAAWKAAMTADLREH